MWSTRYIAISVALLLGIVLVSSIATRNIWSGKIIRSESEVASASVYYNSRGLSPKSESRFDYPPEFYVIQDDFTSIPDANKRIAVGNLALSIEGLPNSNTYKQDVVNLLIDLMMSPDTELATRAYIPEALERFGLLGVPISEVAENQLREIFNKPALQLTTTDIELLEAFEIEGYEALVNGIVEGTFYIDGSNYSFEGGISDIPTVAWSALLVKSKLGDDGAINQAITVIENSDVTDKLFLISNLGQIPNPTIRDYLAYYVYSDEQVYVDFGNPNNPASPLAWFVAAALDNQFQDFPFEFSNAETDERKAELISQVREWLESHPDVHIN